MYTLLFFFGSQMFAAHITCTCPPAQVIPNSGSEETYTVSTAPSLKTEGSESPWTYIYIYIDR